MRARTKINDAGTIDCIVIAADNDQERERLREIYNNILQHLKDLHGKEILPFDKTKSRRRKIASEQCPIATDKKAEGRRKARITKRINRARKGKEG